MRSISRSSSEPPRCNDLIVIEFIVLCVWTLRSVNTTGWRYPATALNYLFLWRLYFMKHQVWGCTESFRSSINCSQSTVELAVQTNRVNATQISRLRFSWYGLICVTSRKRRMVKSIFTAISAVHYKLQLRWGDMQRRLIGHILRIALTRDCPYFLEVVELTSGCDIVTAVQFDSEGIPVKPGDGHEPNELCFEWGRQIVSSQRCGNVVPCKRLYIYSNS